MSQKIHEVLRRASLFLQENKKETNIAELLLVEYLQISRAQFFMMLHDEVPEEVLKVFWGALEQHVETDIPVQHLLGETEFFGRIFKLTDDVLIPRQETEEVVAKAIEEVTKLLETKKEPLAIVDVGTGSGIIGITLAKEFGIRVKVVATDVSASALNVAQKNASALGAEVMFIEGHLLEPVFGQKVDLLISNPPYIPYEATSTLGSGVYEYDPHLALFAEDEGLALYKEMLGMIDNLETEKLVAVFEIGYDQGVSLPDWIKRKKIPAKVEVFKDLNKNDRILTLHYE